MPAPRAGTRIEDTTQIVAQIEREVRRVIPTRELATIVDNIGLNQSPTNMIYNNTGTVGPAGCRHLHHAERRTIAARPTMSAPCAKGCRACSRK